MFDRPVKGATFVPNRRRTVRCTAAVVWQPVEFGRSVKTYEDRTSGYRFESTISRQVTRPIDGTDRSQKKEPACAGSTVRL